MNGPLKSNEAEGGAKCENSNCTAQFFAHFWQRCAASFRSIFPNLRIMLTCSSYDETVEQAWTLGFDIDMAYKHLSRKIVEKFHEKGMLVAAYTANSPAKIVYCASLGVD